MKKNLSTIIALVLALALALGCVSFAAAETAEESGLSAVGYLMYADAGWAFQYWGDSAAEGVTPINADITGAGEYTVGLEFAEEAAGLAFTAVGIGQGELLFPGYTIEVREIRVNDEPIAFTKGYTSSDDGVITRMNL